MKTETQIVKNTVNHLNHMINVFKTNTAMTPEIYAYQELIKIVEKDGIKKANEIVNLATKDKLLSAQQFAGIAQMKIDLNKFN